MGDIDRFRQAFFDKVIESEKKKEQEEKHRQATCFHKYDIVESYANGYELRACAKCGHSAVKRQQVWNGRKGCIIA
jgi:hypothetical protein